MVLAQMVQGFRRRVFASLTWLPSALFRVWQTSGSPFESFSFVGSTPFVEDAEFFEFEHDARRAVATVAELRPASRGGAASFDHGFHFWIVVASFWLNVGSIVFPFWVIGLVSQFVTKMHACPISVTNSNPWGREQGD